MAYCEIGPDSDVHLFTNIKGAFEFHHENQEEPLMIYGINNAITMVNILKDKGLKIPRTVMTKLVNEFNSIMDGLRDD